MGEVKSPPRHSPAVMMKLSEVPRYLRCKHYIEVRKQTVYNWEACGVKGEKLKSRRLGRNKFTTKEWVDEFLLLVARIPRPN